MDISKQTIKPDLNLSHKIDQAILSKNIITDIRDLKLESGKVYTATVIQSKEPLTADDTEQARKPSNAPLPNDPATTDTKAKNTANNEWLILIKGKTALISSEKSLENGQKLLLKLEPSLTGEKPSLSAQLLAKNSPSTQASNKASPLIASTFQLNTQAQTANSIDSANIKVLLQALNLTLDKQLPLQQGFQEISKILNHSQLSVLKPENLKLVTAIKNTLIDTLPKLNDITNLNNETKSTANTIIKQSLFDSGLFLEKNLLSQPEKLIAFKAALASLESIKSNSGTTINNALQTDSTTSSLKTNSQQSYSSAIQKIQQTIDSLLQLASNANSAAPSSKTTSASTTAYHDLKASLISTSSLLIKHLSSELTEAELKNIFLGSIPEQALTSPFAFPMLSTANTSATSKALFDKQELSTGQILKLLAGMIHKLQFNQLHSLLQSNNNNDNPLQQTWFFELPILNTNQSIQTFNFRIDKEPQDSTNEDNQTQDQAFQWKLLLSFDLDNLGPIYVLIKLSQHTISSELWADRESTYTLLQKESPHFKSQLEKIGLNVSDVLCKKGQPNQTKTKLDRHLVDTKA